MPLPTPRREFLALSAWAAGTAGVLVAARPGTAPTGSRTNAEAKRVPLGFAGYEYDRLAALADGRVHVEARELNFEVSEIGDMNTDVFCCPSRSS